MRTRFLLHLGLCGCLFGCSEPAADPPPVQIDLVAEFPFSRATVETFRIDLGQSSSRGFLLAGWSHDEVAADASSTFVWSDGPRSRFWFTLVEARSIELVLTGAPLEVDGAGPLGVAVSVNDRLAVKLELEPGRHAHTVSLPEGLLRVGRNTVTLDYDRTHRPADLGGAPTDHRSLAVQWASIEINGACEGRPPSVIENAAARRLVLPACSRVAYHLDFPEGAVLEFGGARGADVSRDARLAVELASDGDPTTSFRVELEGRSSSTLHRWSLDRGGVVRLALTATGGAVELEHPVVHFDRVVDDVPKRAELEPVEAARPDVLLYVIDTLRADHVGAYGYGRNTTPSLDAFAKQATVFTRAIAQSSWTRSAMASMLTGLDPETHGVRGRHEALSDPALTLAERLAAVGYRTAGFVANVNLKAAFGFDQGFEDYAYLVPDDHPRSLHLDAEGLNDPALQWLAARDRDSPFFLFVHSMEPHDPYDPSPEFERLFVAADVGPEVGSVQHMNRLSRGREQADPATTAALVGRYDGEIAANDSSFGRLLEGMRELGALDDTLVIVASDHGEEFLDHGGWRHGETLYDEQLRVLLVVRFPDGFQAGEVSDALVQQIDIVPTVLEAVGGTAGEATREELPGRSLRLAAAGRDPAPQVVFSTLRLGDHDLEAVTTRTAKWVHDREGGAQMLFDLMRDPAEQHDVLEAHPILAGYLETLSRRARAELPQSLSDRHATLDPVDEMQLRLLGYLEDGAPE